MKAAVIFEYGKAPAICRRCRPTITNSSDVLINIKAAAIKKYRPYVYPMAAIVQASRYLRRSHYQERRCRSAGRRNSVYGIGDGMIAGRAVVKKERLVKLPENLDYATAAAAQRRDRLCNGLLFRARMQAGDTVLINGATGVTGCTATCSSPGIMEPVK